MSKESQTFPNIPQDLQSVLNYATCSIPAPPSSVQEALAEWALIHLSITLESSIRDKFHALARASKNGHITPLDDTHCDNILLSINGRDKYIEWSQFKNLIEQSRFYLGDNNGISNVLTTHMQWLQHLQITRNFVAHNSQESVLKFRKCVESTYFTPQSVLRTSPGSFLVSQINRGALARDHHSLIFYFALNVDKFLHDLKTI